MANEKMKTLINEIVEQNNIEKLNKLIVKIENAGELREEFLNALIEDDKKAYFFLINAENYSGIVKEIKKNFEKTIFYKNIKKHIYHNDLNVKKYFLKELGMAKSEVFADIFIGMLREKDWEVRLQIAGIISKYNGDTAIMLLLSMLDDADRRVVKEVVVILAEKGENVLLYLEKYMTIPMERLKINILELLNKIGSAGALKFVIQMCGDESEKVRIEAQNLALYILDRHTLDEDREGYNVIFHFLKKEIERLDLKHAATIIKIILKFRENGAKVIITDMEEKWNTSNEYKKILMEIKSEDKIYLVEEMLKSKKEDMRKVGIELLYSIDARTVKTERIEKIITDYIAEKDFIKNESEIEKVAGYLVKSKIFEKMAKNIHSVSAKERKSAIIIISIVSQDEKIYELIVELLKDPDRDVRYEALRAIGKTGKEEYIKYFEEMLADPDENIQIESLKIISEIKGEQSKEIIMKAMNHPNDNVKEEAVKLIAKESLKKYIDSFDLLNEFNKKRVGVLMENLGNKTEEILFEEINSTDINTRRRVMEILKYIKDKYKFKEIMKKAMQDPDKNIRSGVVKLLINISDREILVGLLKLLNDPDKRVRANTIEAFGNMEGKTKEMPMEMLYPFLKDEDNRIRANAIMALVNMGKKEVENELDEMFESSSELMRASGIYAAGELKLKNKIKFIERLSEDKSVIVRKNIIIYYYKIGEKSKIERFLKDSDKSVTETAKKYYMM